jgi:hypothetical protein
MSRRGISTLLFTGAGLFFAVVLVLWGLAIWTGNARTGWLGALGLLPTVVLFLAGGATLGYKDGVKK